MASPISSVATPVTPIQTKECRQCGAIDKKLSACGRCHIEKYCSRECQATAWPAHKKVCLMSEVAQWSGRKFGELRGHRTLDNNVRILSHTGGFTIFLPPVVWRALDYTVFLSLPESKEIPCWIAGRDFAYVKIDVDPTQLDDSTKKYMDDDVNVTLDHIARFVKINYFDNPQAYPQSHYFSHGHIEDHPDDPRPYRIRIEGDFRYRF